MNRIIRYPLVLFVLLLAPSAHAETLNCTPVTSLPATISTQGIHCLTGNLATNIFSGNAITINANNVTLDLNGFKVGGQAAGTATTANGIFSAANNVTISNGIVRGFQTGIDLTGRGAVVEDMLVDQNTQRGIQVTGQGSIVRRNQVVDTGGSTFIPNLSALGIRANGPGSLVQGNLVSGLTATGTASEFGIRVFGANSLAIGNFVTDSARPTGGGLSFGIEAVTGANINVLGNTVSNMSTCIQYTSATGLFANNTVTGCDLNFNGGTAGQQGNNF